MIYPDAIQIEEHKIITNKYGSNSVDEKLSWSSKIKIAVKYWASITTRILYILMTENKLKNLKIVDFKT